MQSLGEYNVQGIVLAGVHRRDETVFDAQTLAPLMPIARKPLIAHVLDWLRDAGVARMTICTNKGSRQIRDALGCGNKLGVDLNYYEDWTPRGPAGCILDAALEMNAGVYVVVDGTILPQCDLHALLRQHEGSQAAMTITTAPDPSSLDERTTPVGIYVINRSVLECIPETGYQDVKEILLPQLHRRGTPAHVHALNAPCRRLTDPISYLAMNAAAIEWLAAGECESPEYSLIDGCLVHETARLDDGCVLIGPALIGPRARIERGAAVVGPVVVGADCLLEEDSAVCGSVLWRRCRVGKRASLNRCVLSGGAEVYDGETIRQSFRVADDSHDAAYATQTLNEHGISLTRFMSRSSSRSEQTAFAETDRDAQPSKIGAGKYSC